MKVCEFCGSECADNEMVCPSCGGDSFREASEKPAETGRESQEVNDGAVYSRSGCSLVLWIFLWVVIFPIPLTKVVCRQRDWHKWLKAAVIVFAWVAYLAICFIAKKEVDTARKSNTDFDTVTSSAVSDTSTVSEKKTPVEGVDSQPQESDSTAHEGTDPTDEETSRQEDGEQGKGNTVSGRSDTSSGSGASASNTDQNEPKGKEDSWTEEDTDF